jgi:cytochrome c oxidase subunit 2
MFTELTRFTLFGTQTGERLQSALHPASAPAQLMHELALVMTVAAAAIFILVLALTLYGLLTPPRRVAAGRWVIGGGIVFPSVVLAALLVYSLQVVNRLSAEDPICRPAERTAEIEVIGKMWWWEVRYNDLGTGTQTVLANELHLPVGRAVDIALRSDNVIHSFWVPPLAGKVDMIPGRTNRLKLEAAAPGVYRGQCAEYCGVQHAWMAFYVVAKPEEDYRQWLAQQATPAKEPKDTFLRRGREAFLREGCGACHTVRGTEAKGVLGPDLTHIGSRQSLAAGMLDNHVGTLAGWIADSQGIKPGNLMPSMNVFSGDELRAVAAYLDSLE